MDQQPTLWSFTLVGMKYHGTTAKEAEEYNRVVLVPEPNNPIDRKAIKVLGYNAADDVKVLGYVSMDSQPTQRVKVPAHDEGTIYQVYSSRASSSGATQFLLFLNKTEPFLV